MHRRVSVKCPLEPNHLLDHQESRQGLSLGSFVCCFLAETPSPVSVGEKGIPAEIRGLGGCENWERTSRKRGGVAAAELLWRGHPLLKNQLQGNLRVNVGKGRTAKNSSSVRKLDLQKSSV